MAAFIPFPNGAGLTAGKRRWSPRDCPQGLDAGYRRQKMHRSPWASSHDDPDTLTFVFIRRVSRIWTVPACPDLEAQGLFFVNLSLVLLGNSCHHQSMEKSVYYLQVPTQGCPVPKPE